jgi:replication factor A1
LKIVELKEGQRNVTLTGRIMRVAPPREVQTRYGPAKVATSTLVDESGAISLNLWRTQIDLVREGDSIRIDNAFVRVFNGNLELNIGADGKISLLSRSGREVMFEGRD